jgi:hypothetical protein
MKSFAILSALFLVGCSHVSPTLVTMDLPFAPELVEEMQKSANRAPASLEVTDVEGKSSRRVYFTALYHQYLTMGQHLNLPSDVNSCPQFHHDKIETDSAVIPKFSLFHLSSVNSDSKEFFPELVFNKSFSLKDHHQGIREEVEVLCEEGLSDNFYKFDNLITHYASKKSFHSRPDSMKSVLKIPVFANYYLLKMLQSPHALSFVHPEEKKVFTMTQTQWFEKYVTEANRKRNNLIKNHMVQR